MRLLIAGGGTGGHIYPALAVVRSLLARPDAPEVRWLGGHRGLESQLVRAERIPFERLLLRSLRTVDASVATALDPVRLALSVPQAAALLMRERPDAIFTTGGYVAVPTLLAAAPLRIPVVMWDGNVVPGRSVRMTARLATTLAVSFESTCRALGRGEDCYVTGTPIRDSGAITRADAREQLDLPADLPLVLIFGGSQAVRRFNAAVSSVLPQLVERVAIIHVTGESEYAPALALRESLPAELRDRYRPHAFIRDEMTACLAAADLVVGRAGSSTLAEVTAFGLPMVVVPYPHAAGHQRANAKSLVAAGAARFIEDADFDGAALLGAVAILDDAELLASMRTAARGLARPGAAAAVAELVMCAAEGHPRPSQRQIEEMARAPLSGRPDVPAVGAEPS